MSGSIEAAHAELLRQLKALDAVCAGHGIAYSLHGGSLLGAVRHQGFIPWDDDVDITMTRAEYEKLRAVLAAGESEYRLFFLHMPRFVPRALPELEHFFWSDIIVYDYISDNALARRLKIGGVMFLQAMLRTKGTLGLMRGKDHGRGQMALFSLAYGLGRLLPYRAKMRLFDAFCKHCFTGRRRTIHRSNDKLSGVRTCLPRELMETYTRVPFEDTELMIGARPQEVLTRIYGPDYMTPVQDVQNESEHAAFKTAFYEAVRTDKPDGRL